MKREGKDQAIYIKKKEKKLSFALITPLWTRKEFYAYIIEAECNFTFMMQN